MPEVILSESPVAPPTGGRRVVRYRPSTDAAGAAGFPSSGLVAGRLLVYPL